MLNSKLDDKNIGLLKNLFWLRQNLDVYCLISVNAASINKIGIGKSFWGFLQKLCIDSIALNICKIYEYEKAYELNSVEGVLKKIIDDQSSALDSSEVDVFLKKYDSPNGTLSLCIKRFKQKYEKELERFKIHRDKHVAHSEHGFNPNNLPSYDVMERLFDFGADFYILVSATFVSTASVSVVPCDLKSDRKVKVGLKRVLDKLGLTEIKTQME
jgi:hypothetical protein